MSVTEATRLEPDEEVPRHVRKHQAKQRGEEVVTHFARLAPELARRDKGLPAKDPAARRSLEYLYDAELQPVREYGAATKQRAMQVALDCKTRGAEACQWYAATLPYELAWMVPTDPARTSISMTGGRTRARGAGRPAGRGACRRSSAKSGDSGSDPHQASPSRRLTGREDIEHWLDERRKTLGALTATNQLALTELAA